MARISTSTTSGPATSTACALCASRVATVDQGNPDGTLDLVYVTEDERHVHEAFDMVVLSVGLEPSKGTAS
jgi:heterodisulfide reductase subunit A-like polyferredoxin